MTNQKLHEAMAQGFATFSGGQVQELRTDGDDLDERVKKLEDED